MDSIDKEYDRLVQHLHDCKRKAQSSKTTKRSLSSEIIEQIIIKLHELKATKTSCSSSQGFAERPSKRVEQKCFLKLQRRERSSVMAVENSPIERRDGVHSETQIKQPQR
ncbi:hypothetical protein RB195_014502 [Necator americanus]|uniref:Uncharacterized protein n=1 Tax=Necator americanus TaxID=51031 RepID=A0ABR1E227_NECAM